MTHVNETASRAEPFAASLADANGMNAVLAANWWAIALRGIVAILFGLYALFLTGPALLTLVLVFAVYMVVDAVFATVAAIRAARRHQRWGLLVLEAVANLVAGVIAFLWPGITVLVFVILIAAWSLISGGLAIGAAFRLKRDFGRWWMFLGGLASVVLGVLLVLAPLLGAVVLTWWLGAYAIVFGIAQLALAYRLRVHKDDSIAGFAPAT